MKIYLMRHGRDDDTVRGGWSKTSLTEQGIIETEKAAEQLTALNIKQIYSSDLLRAKQTAEIISEKLNIPITYIKELREVNNGDLAGMKNSKADVKYPGLYWHGMEWEQKYPNGECPREFYGRVKTAWEKLQTEIIKNNEDVMLITHGGVIEILFNILLNWEYSNKTPSVSIQNSAYLEFEYKNGKWRLNDGDFITDVF